jgi:hypothetical protein
VGKLGVGAPDQHGICFGFQYAADIPSFKTIVTGPSARVYLFSTLYQKLELQETMRTVKTTAMLALVAQALGHGYIYKVATEDAM